MPNKRSFLKQFWKEKKMVGAMAPSSRFLAKKMLKNIDFENARILIELGPGNGVFTEKIIEKMHPDAKLLVFEFQIFRKFLKNILLCQFDHLLLLDIYHFKSSEFSSCDQQYSSYIIFFHFSKKS